jgi:hypothetical protein
MLNGRSLAQPGRPPAWPATSPAGHQPGRPPAWPATSPASHQPDRLAATESASRTATPSSPVAALRPPGAHRTPATRPTQPGPDRRDRTARTGPPGPDRPDRTAGTGPPGPDRPAQPARTDPHAAGSPRRNTAAPRDVHFPVGVLCPPGRNYCLRGIPSGWSRVAPLAERRPHTGAGHALASATTPTGVLSFHRTRARAALRPAPGPIGSRSAVKLAERSPDAAAGRG